MPQALAEGADIVVMLHPDYQYEPRLITAMAAMVASGVYDVVIGSRILGNTAIAGGMPRYKYVANRVLTALAEPDRRLQAVRVPYRLSRILAAGSRNAAARGQLGGLHLRQPAADPGASHSACASARFPVRRSISRTASEISFGRAAVYGLGVLWTSVQYRLWRWGLVRPRIFAEGPEQRLAPASRAQPPDRDALARERTARARAHRVARRYPRRNPRRSLAALVPARHPGHSRRRMARACTRC